MQRTSRRPLVASGGRRRSSRVRRWCPASLLGVAATLLLGLLANWLSAALADGAILFYVFVYTLGLKRRTASNIVIGGAAGCFPVLVGWAAVTGTVELAGGRAVRRHLLLDAAALLGAGDEVQGRLRRRPACRCCRSSRTAATVARKILLLLLRHGRPPRWRWRRMPAGSTGPAPAASAAGSCVEAHRLRSRVAAGEARRRRCGCSTCRSPTSPCCSRSIAVTALLPWRLTGSRAPAARTSCCGRGGWPGTPSRCSPPPGCSGSATGSCTVPSRATS